MVKHMYICLIRINHIILYHSRKIGCWCLSALLVPGSSNKHNETGTWGDWEISFLERCRSRSWVSHSNWTQSEQDRQIASRGPFQPMILWWPNFSWQTPSKQPPRFLLQLGTASSFIYLHKQLLDELKANFISNGCQHQLTKTSITESFWLEKFLKIKSKCSPSTATSPLTPVPQHRLDTAVQPLQYPV